MSCHAGVTNASHCKPLRYIRQHPTDFLTQIIHDTADEGSLPRLGNILSSLYGTVSPKVRQAGLFKQATGKKHKAWRFIKQLEKGIKVTELLNL